MFATFETYFSFKKTIYGFLQLIIIIMYFYVTVLSTLTTILQLTYRSTDKCYSFITFSFLINAAISLLNCFVWICYLYISFSCFSAISPGPLHELLSVLKDSLSLYFFYLFCISPCPMLFQPVVVYRYL